MAKSQSVTSQSHRGLRWIVVVVVEWIISGQVVLCLNGAAFASHGAVGSEAR